MSGKSDTYERAVEDYLFRRVAPTVPPATCYVALYEASDPPTDAGGGTEATYTGYARQAVNMTEAMWGTAGTPPENQSPITFPAPTTAGPHPTVSHFAIHSHASNDAPVVVDALNEGRTPQQGTDLVFAAGDFTYTED